MYGMLAELKHKLKHSCMFFWVLSWLVYLRNYCNVKRTFLLRKMFLFHDLKACPEVKGGHENRCAFARAMCNMPKVDVFQNVTIA